MIKPCPPHSLQASSWGRTGCLQRKADGHRGFPTSYTSPIYGDGPELFSGAWLCRPWFRPCLLPCLHSPSLQTLTPGHRLPSGRQLTLDLWGYWSLQFSYGRWQKNHSSLPRPAPNAPSPSMRQKASIKLLRAGGDRSAQGSHCRLNYQRSLETFRLEGDGRGEEEVKDFSFLLLLTD